DERSEVLDDAGEAPRGAVRIGDLRPADGAVVCRRLEEDPRPPAGVAEERLEPRDLHSRGEYGRRGRSTRGSEAVRASTSARARSQSSSSSTLKPSYPLVRNGATVRPSRVPVAKTTRVQAISSALFWTWTSGSAWYWPACQAASRCDWSSSGRIVRPSTIHIFPGCCFTRSTARIESASGVASSCSRPRRNASGPRNGFVARTIANRS